MKYRAALDYAQERRKNYPPLPDQLDAIWKGGADMESMRAAVLAVREQYLEPTDDPLDQAKRIRIGQIKRWRNSVEYSTFKWNGSTFDADMASQGRIQGAFQLANLALATNAEFSINWTLADNTELTMSAMDVVGMGRALAQHIITAHTIARSLKAAVGAATTLDEVEAVVWP